MRTRARSAWLEQLLGIVGLVVVSGASACAVIAYDRHDERTGFAEAALLRTPEQASAQQAIALMRSSLLALHHANLADDYSTMRQLTAPQFQATNSVDRLRQIFEEPRAGDWTFRSRLSPNHSGCNRLESALMDSCG